MRFRIGALVAIASLSVSCTSGADVPSIDDTSKISDAEYQTSLIECAAEFGFEGKVAADGGVHFSTTEEQGERLRQVVSDCNAQIAPPDPNSMSRESQTAYFEALLLLAECAKSQGLSPPPAPTLDAFLDSPEWHPFNNITVGINMTEAEWSKLTEVCPQP